MLLFMQNKSLQVFCFSVKFFDIFLHSNDELLYRERPSKAIIIVQEIIPYGMQTLSKQDILSLIENKELSNEVIKSSPIVVSIFTQGWCGDWHRVQTWLKNVEPSSDDFSIFLCVYDEDSHFDQIKAVKEDLWDNHLIPYFRFYSGGVFKEAYNAISERKFLKVIESLKSDT